MVMEKRLSYLEGQMSVQAQMVSDVRDAVRHLDQRMELRFESLDQKVSRQFLWLVGLQVTAIVTTLATVVGALIGRS